ncbi:MAG: 4Fe-4S binding protein [Anaerolineae bacterium]
MTTSARALSGPPRLGVWKGLLLWLPIALISALTPLQVLQSGEVGLFGLAALIAWAVFNTFFALIFITGKTHRFRAVLFVLVAVALPLEFIPYMIETYGSMMLTEATMLSSGASFCPLTMPMILIPALFKRVVIFPGELLPGAAHGAFSVMFIVWVGSSLALGRGWCSWGCFYGGWDELFSRIRVRKRPLFRKIDRRWIYLPFAVLLAIVLLSALTYGPVYCEWLCPFKIVTEFQAPSSALAIFQIATFVSLFIGLVVVLPLLSRRRVQCGLFCPFGAMQSLLNKINIFEVRIDTEKCSKCQRCLRSCPTFSLDESSLESGKPLLTCTKCAACIDACPQGAIAYHIKGTRIGVRPNVARGLYLYPAMILMSFIGAGIFASGLYRVLKLVATGSMI